MERWPARILEEGPEALRPHLLAEAPSVPKTGDFDLNPSGRPPGPVKLTPAAVLMPIVRRPEPTMLFTRRTPHLARHAGQVAFPGGRMDAADPHPIATALRETAEETGIAASAVDIAGFLDVYETGSGFAIVPVVGILDPGFTLTPDPGEVDEVFEVPLAFLLDPANREIREAAWQDRRGFYYAWTYGPHYIWGVTAGILSGFVERLKRVS